MWVEWLVRAVVVLVSLHGVATIVALVFLERDMRRTKFQHSEYHFSTTWSEADQEWVATCTRYPSMSWLGPTREAAQAGLLRLLAGVLEDTGA